MNQGGRGRGSVNWVTGMLLGPEHFDHQDRYIDESVGWVVRYCVAGAGLLGGGMRMDPRHEALARFDPRVEVQDDGETVRVSVLEARGITPTGEGVEVTSSSPVGVAVPKAELAGLKEVLVHLLPTAEKEEDPATVGLDDVNPHQAAFRRPRYVVKLGADAEVAARSLVVGRLRRASDALGFDRDAHFIPPCVSIVSHSALHHGWRRITDDVAHLAARYAELHRVVAAYAEQIAQRGVDPAADHEIRVFVREAVLALDTCAYEILDPVMAPHRFFLQVERAGRRVAIALDLSGGTRLYLQMLSGADSGYGVLLEEERQLVAGSRGAGGGEELQRSLERATQAVHRLTTLLEALEGKYLDYRINRAIDSLRFLLEGGGEGFYAAIATPAHPQREGDLLVFDFAQLGLPGRHEYRVLLIGEPQGVSPWQVGETLEADVWVNPAAGGGRPISRAVRVEVVGQRNFAVDFETPLEVATIATLRVAIHDPARRVRRAVLYQRARGLLGGSAPVEAVTVAAPAPSPSPLSRASTSSGAGAPAVHLAPAPAPPAAAIPAPRAAPANVPGPGAVVDPVHRLPEPPPAPLPIRRIPLRRPSS